MVGGHLDFLKKKKKMFFRNFWFWPRMPTYHFYLARCWAHSQGAIRKFAFVLGPSEIFECHDTGRPTCTHAVYTHTNFSTHVFWELFRVLFFFFNYFPKVVHAIRAKKMPKVSKNRLLSKKPTNRGDIEAKKRWGGT